MNAEIVCRTVELAEYTEQWRRLAQTPLQSPEWLLNWWDAYSSPVATLNTLTVCSPSGQLLGLAPLYFRDSWGMGRTLRFLGSGEACSDFQSILCVPGYETPVAAAISQALIDSSGDGGWGICEFEGVGTHDPVLGQVVKNLQTAGYSLDTKQLESTWRVDLQGDWDQVVGRMCKSMRRQTRSLLKQFDGSEALKLTWSDSPTEFAQAFETLQDLHQQRWEQAGKEGCFASSRFSKFTKAACQALHAKRQCSIATLVADQTPVASSLLLHGAQGNYVYQTGRDPNFPTQRYGTMLNALLLREMQHRQFQFVDFLRGNEVYKDRLGAVPSECVRIRVVAPRILPRLRYGAWMLGSRLRRNALALSDPANLDTPPAPSFPKREQAE
ncbi:GNAT family N-acetyltransferase [Aureliella helgolandensis]|uniref:BioF2-like acetyltransferase domain-containing protein n=1 Tax=Aureliella helgolandensis TaxID=2527968 RepID=A0A518G8P6_9BACT|nr:GNAT family N-acetyltransferase [Aureliella helgolandensis]QDV24958.1 hypothetical protein Q31a_32800 [Aureliella helgolandensis]